MSHQHGGKNEASCETFYEMGYRHFAFSNYYPSQPIEALPAGFAQCHADVIVTPNAEHHSLSDTSLHFNGLGSRFASGYGQTVPPSQLEACPVSARFDGLCTEAAASYPGQSLYRLDITIVSRDCTFSGPAAFLTVEGALEHDPSGEGSTRRRLVREPLCPGVRQIYLRVQHPSMEVRLEYDAGGHVIERMRLMQGMNRPWREAFRAVLDGESLGGCHQPGLEEREGGLTLNHPVEDFRHYLPMLDFDPRVLGVEVWNYRRGFGSPLSFYQVWDDILRTGRRCWGFFVKDHRMYERGRNILLVPKGKASSPGEREKAALRAYRRGAFFGSVGALSVDRTGKPVAPFDRSDFRFSRISVGRDNRRRPRNIEVRVEGNDPLLRPNVQVRLITAKGVELIVDGPVAVFPLEMSAQELLSRRFIRVEAFACPDRDGDGRSLTGEALRKMDVAQVAALRTGGEPENGTPAADMIFSQPLRVVSNDAESRPESLE
ncbi:MAG TPA: hypothetical protein VNQ90_09780 [Chthoniobacteraceae bacterium]|nr:hypothetical protein [Chthoniobacteraceae bacterium]